MRYRELTALAKEKKRQFLFESTVMDGVPIFSLFSRGLPAAELRGFSGVLNSTSNVVLTEVERGRSFDEAVKRAQAMGIAETDPIAGSGWVGLRGESGGDRHRADGQCRRTLTRCSAPAFANCPKKKFAPCAPRGCATSWSAARSGG